MIVHGLFCRFVFFGSVAAILAACSGIPIVEPDPITLRKDQMNIVSAPDFLLVIGNGSGHDGFDVFRIDATGSCEYTYRFAPSKPELPWRWKRARFTIKLQVVDRLRHEIENQRILQMMAMYRVANLADGTQKFVKLRASGQWKFIWCDNNFPHEVTSLFDYIRSEILAPNHEEIDSAEEVVLEPKDWESPFSRD